MSDRVARAALSRLSEPADTRLTGLVERLGATKVLSLLREERDLAGAYTDVAARFQELHPERELEQAAARGIRFVCPGDSEWPTRIDALAYTEPLHGRGGAPMGLWVRGPLSVASACERSAAVVGSRSATTYGTGVAGELAAHLADNGMCVVSGAAFGIDQAAHRGALAMRGPTVAVLACGVDRPYPAAHKRLLDYIAETGLLVSELPPGCAPTRSRFLTRNRLIAALTQGTVVVEAAIRSGALNTANWALRLNRQVMGVPGPVTSAPSQGVHELIRSRDAALVTGGADVLELLSPAGAFLTEEPREAERPRDRLTQRQREVLDAVPVFQAAGAKSIARVAGVSETEVVDTLGALRGLRLVEEAGDQWRLAARLATPGQEGHAYAPGGDGSSGRTRDIG